MDLFQKRLQHPSKYSFCDSKLALWYFGLSLGFQGAPNSVIQNDFPAWRQRSAAGLQNVAESNIIGVPGHATVCAMDF